MDVSELTEEERGERTRVFTDERAVEDMKYVAGDVAVLHVDVPSTLVAAEYGDRTVNVSKFE